MIDLRLGDWATVLADVGDVDAVITDPPYGRRCHVGHDLMAESTRNVTGQETRRSLQYAYWTPDDVDAFVDAWIPRCKGFFVAMTSHDLISAYESAYLRHGRFTFAPVAIIQPRFRASGDGPSSDVVYAMVCRPKSRKFFGGWSSRGYYLAGTEKHGAVAGAKPVQLMRALVRAYSRSGDVVCDPCAGGATTLIAAAQEGRQAVGAELDATTYAAATARIRRTFIAPPLFDDSPERISPCVLVSCDHP